MAQVSLSGAVQIGGQDVYTESSVQQMSLGVYAETADGRGYRYCKVGATALVAGKVYQSSALDATNLQVSGGFAVAAAAIGATEVTTTTTGTITKDFLAGGYMSVCVTPGEGHIYRIKGNTAASGAAYTIYLEDPIRVALTTGSNVIFAKHPYDSVVIEPGTPTGVIVGVASHVITAAYYGWMQTHGPASVLFTGTGVAGKAVGSLSGGTSGSAAPAIAATNIIGYHMATGITTEYALIYLTLN
ncbi:MAG: hypothetical protein WC047_08445 [Kiritimatiellales bacterium]